MAIKTDTNDVNEMTTELFKRMYDATPRDKRRGLSADQVGGRLAWAQDISSILLTQRV